MNEETKILATVDGKPRTISESSLRRHLKLNDAKGISSLPDTELFENLSLIGLKSTGFNEFSSNIATAVVYLATNRVYNFSKMIFDGMGEGSTISTEPHHTPSSQEQHSSQQDTSSPSHPTTTTEPIPPTPIEIPTKTPTLRQYFRRATRIAQSKALSRAADEPASLLRDDSQGEAFFTVSSLDAGHDRENIIRPLPCPMNHHQGLLLLMLMRAIGDEVRVERSTELRSNDTEEMVNVLSAMEAANILTSGVAAISVFPVAATTTVGVLTVSGLVPTVSVIFTTASVRLSEQLARNSKIARLHAEEELKMMIEGLDRSNEMIAKHLYEYEQAAADLSIREKTELINELEQRKFYMSVLKSHAGWKTRHFRGMTLEEIKEKFIPVWKQIEDFVPMSLKEEGERMKRKGLKLDQGSAKKMKTSEDVLEEDLKGMMQLIPLEEVAKEFPLLSCSIAPAEEFALLDGDKDYSQSKMHYSQSKTCVSYSWNVSYPLTYVWPMGFLQSAMWDKVVRSVRVCECLGVDWMWRGVGSSGEEDDE
nr:hypothetical protein [Tanacetum cinerariifolium]